MTLLLWGMFPTGLLQGSGCACGMMTVTIMLMMRIIFFKWYDDYKKRKAQKASIKEGFLQNI